MINISLFMLTLKSKVRYGVKILDYEYEGKVDSN